MNSTNANAKPLHVVLGAGQIGTLLVDRLVARGERVRQVRRSASGRGVTGAAPTGAPRPGVELVHGDLSDASFARAAMAGADVVYHAVNARYDQWHELLLPLTRGILAGATGTNARLVMLDCLYMYGRPDGPMREDSPVRPCSKKGELRARQSEDVLAAHARGDVRATIGRASDFIGPFVGNALFGERFWPAALAGKPVEVFGDVDQPHSYSYSDDVARALLTLGAHESALGQVWHLPVVPATTTRAMIAQIFTALGHDPATTPPRHKHLADWFLRTLGLAIPMLREVAEMTYQWKLPYVMDDSRFRAAFAGDPAATPTPVAEQIAATIAWARRAHAPQAGRSASLATVLRP
jgi:nucleoside-diphosphate-sugar epimerase